jgi:hypothetical protein
MHFYKVHILPALIRQALQSLTEGTFSAPRKSYDPNFNHGAKLLLFYDLCNT